MYRLTLMLIVVSAYASGLSETAHADDSFNLRTNPIAWVVGPNARLDYELNDTFTVGLGGNYVDRQIRAVDMNGQAGVLYLTYNFEASFTDGWFAEAGAGYGSYKAQANESAGAVDTLQVHNISGTALAGYHWFWDWFSLSLAGMFYVNSAGGKPIQNASGNTVANVPYPASGGGVDLSLGVMF